MAVSSHEAVGILGITQLPRDVSPFQFCAVLSKAPPQRMRIALNLNLRSNLRDSHLQVGI